ncbi:4-(cytidine 5'-diphospho)-2-C-methyl-D-erythritol kinase [Sphingomonas sp.]|uniref:4-(cytidine 5'-diphospho)-2-C-methyl-D-erythritol kinase n=1 Tax=Sphingomonas sp. TaxID=28214 RepID=UPI003CC6D89B
MITEPAPAKINLALHIRRKRPDGYHDLETLFAFARDGDMVTVAPAERDSFTVTGPFAKALGDGDNLVTRARDGFRLACSCAPVTITLDKNLPVASGIGGGSADAAATLRALARLTGVDPADQRLFATAAGLGADVPACLRGQTAFATGRGDDLQPLPPLGDLPLLLVNPNVPLSTAAMFAAWDGVDRGPIPRRGATLACASAGHNDFTQPAVRAAPVVGEVLLLLNAAPGCTFVRMSGSGATCFGLFTDAGSRDMAAAAAAERGWWTLRTFAT